MEIKKATGAGLGVRHLAVKISTLTGSIPGIVRGVCVRTGGARHVGISASDHRRSLQDVPSGPCKYSLVIGLQVQSRHDIVKRQADAEIVHVEFAFAAMDSVDTTCSVNRLSKEGSM